MRIDHQQVASHPCNLGLAFVGLFDPEEVYAPVQIRSNVLHFHAVNRHGWRLTQGVKIAHYRDSLEADGVADVGPVGLVDAPDRLGRPAWCPPRVGCHLRRRGWRASPLRGGGLWVYAAGRRPSRQATVRVCVQRAKEAPGRQGKGALPRYLDVRTLCEYARDQVDE